MRGAEKTSGPGQQHKDHQAPDDDLAKLAEPILDGERFHHADKNAAQHRPAQVAHAADRHDGQRLQAEGEADVGGCDAGAQREHQSARTCQRRGNEECLLVDALHINAEQLGEGARVVEGTVRQIAASSNGLAQRASEHAATLQEKNASNNPILIRIDTNSGHGASNTAKNIETMADIYSFILFNMGFTPKF